MSNINEGGLTIPEEAIEVARRDPVVWKYLTNRATADTVVQAVIEAAAPLIVAAELERLVANLEWTGPVELVDLTSHGRQYSAGKAFVAGQLRQRAAELRVGAS